MSSGFISSAKRKYPQGHKKTILWAAAKKHNAILLSLCVLGTETRDTLFYIFYQEKMMNSMQDFCVLNK